MAIPSVAHHRRDALHMKVALHRPSRFLRDQHTYGALGAVVGLMMWMWLSIIVVLVGAEVNSKIEHQTAHDSTVGLAKPLGVRGADMADTVGVGVP